MSRQGTYDMNISGQVGNHRVPYALSLRNCARAESLPIRRALVPIHQGSDSRSPPPFFRLFGTAASAFVAAAAFLAPLIGFAKAARDPPAAEQFFAMCPPVHR